MIRKGGQVVLNPFSEAGRRKMGSRAAKDDIYFGPWKVTNQVFLTTSHSFALVNLKPLLPGHVLICPHQPHKRLTDLSVPELTDLFQVVQRVQRMLARHYFTTPRTSSGEAAASSSSQQIPAKTPEAGSFNIAVQDGSEAGQTVPHVHVHIIPRIPGKTDKPEGPSDHIYELMATEPGNVGGKLWDRWMEKRPEPGGAFAPIEDADRKSRSDGEMEEEADMFRTVLEEMEKEDGEKSEDVVAR